MQQKQSKEEIYSNKFLYQKQKEKFQVNNLMAQHLQINK
jgi:hypothetical protein